MLPFYFIKKVPKLEKKLYKMYENRALQIVPKIESFIPKKGRILDIGCGTGVISKLIKKRRNPRITLVDVDFNEMCDQYPVLIYDGEKLPFKDKLFSASCLIAVLHHTQNVGTVLEEVKRVTRGNIIVMEDIFTDFFGRAITFIGDCLVNWEIHSPFKNNTKEGWIKIFKKHKLEVVSQEEFRLRCVGFPFKLAVFVLSAKSS